RTGSAIYAGARLAYPLVWDPKHARRASSRGPGALPLDLGADTVQDGSAQALAGPLAPQLVRRKACAVTTAIKGPDRCQYTRAGKASRRRRTAPHTARTRRRTCPKRLRTSCPASKPTRPTRQPSAPA